MSLLNGHSKEVNDWLTWAFRLMLAGLVGWQIHETNVTGKIVAASIERDVRHDQSLANHETRILSLENRGRR